MKLVLLSLVLTYVSAGVTERPDGCVWGPSYWCSSLDHARDCGATKHCLDAVWSMQIIKQDSNEYCTYCQLAVTELKSLLSDKSTEDEIAAAAAKACELLPDPDWKDQCKGIVMQYADLLLEMLAKNMSPLKICAAAGFCKGFEDRVSPYGIQATDVTTAAPNTTCQDCERFFTDVQQSITSKDTLNSLLQLVNQSLCSQLGSFGDLCMNFFKDNLPTALQVLADQVDPNIVCRVFGFCTSDLANAPALQIPLKNVFQVPRKTPLKYRSSEECDACKEVMGQVVSEIRDKTVQEKIEDVLETDFCGALGGLSATCKQLVEEYAPMLFELLANEFDPTTFCQYVGMCPVPTLYEIRPIVTEKAVSQQVASSELCDICKLAVGEVDSLLQDNATEKEIQSFLEQFCQKLSAATLVKQCTDFVQTYGPLYMYELAKKLQPDVVCTAIKLCTAKSLEEKIRLDDAVCDLCADVVLEVETLLGNMTAEELEKDLLPLCDVIPIEEYKKMCVTYVNQYAPLVVDFLKTKPDPRSVCALAGVCNASLEMTVMSPALSKIPEQTPVEAGPSEMCKICDTILFAAKELLKNKQTQEEILAELKKLCDEFPSEATMCKALVESEGKAILEKLASGIEPGTICKELGLCQSSKQLTKIPPPVILSPLDTLPVEGVEKLEAPVDAGPSEMCKICDTVLFAAKELLENKQTEEEILAELKKLCDEFPSEATMCKALVESEGKAILEKLASGIEPGTICKELGLCQSSKQLTKIPPPVILSPLDTLPVEGVEKLEGVTSCKVCDTAMYILKLILGNSITEDSIAAGLEFLCNKLPPEMQGQCDNMVMKYEPEIIKYALQDLDTVCLKLSLCPSLLNTVLKPAGIMSPYDTLPLVGLEDKKEPALTSAVTCEVCDMVMKYLVKYVGDTKTEAEIESLLLEGCDHVAAILEGECKTLVNTYTKEIINFILLDFSSQQICEGLRLCTAAPTKTLPQPVHVKLLKDNKHVAPVDHEGNSVTCEVCKYAMSYLEDMLKENKTEEAIKKALDELCSHLPSIMQAECTSIVNEYTDQIVDLITQGLSPADVCKELGLCAALEVGSWKADVHILPAGAVQPSVAQSDHEANPVTCEVCEYAMSYLENMLKEKTTEEAIREALDKLCSYIPSSLEAECTSFVNEYTDEVVKLIAEGLSPAEVCKELRLCAALEVGIWKADVHILPAGAVQPSVAQSDHEANPVTCEVCEYAMSYLENMLKEKTTEEAIKEALDKLCSYIPSMMQAECTSLVNQYADEVVKLIAEGLPPAEVCKELGLCAALEAGSWKADVHILPAAAPKSSSDVNDIKCTACEMVVKEVKDLLSKNSSEADAKKALLDLCAKLSGELKTECDSFVNEYFDLVYKLIEQGIDPKQICQQLQLCPSGIVTLDVSAECVMCEFVIKTLATYLNENSTEADIEKDLEYICSRMPDTISGECEEFVQKYAGMIMDLIKEAADPKTICTAVGACTKASEQKVIEGKLEGSEECNVCEFMIQELFKILSKNATKEEVKAELEKVCSILPSTVRTECKSLVDTYEDVIIDFITHGVDPSVICTTIGLCNGKRKTMALMEAKGQTIQATKKDVKCDACEIVCHLAEVYLHQNKTEKQIEQLLDKACDVLPDTVTVQCKAEVKQFTPEIVKDLQNDMDPDQVCPALQLCPQKPSNDDTLFFKPVSQQKMLGARKCSWGPAYWCANPDNAKACNAVEHCKKHVWN